jgi:hypothetical protein
MSGFNKEVAIIRELAKRYMEIAVSDKHVKMRQRFCDTNDLKIVRPPVCMDEIPWHEMNYEGALDCLCEDERLRRIEYDLRVALYREKYFKCDNFIEPCWRVFKSYTDSGLGFKVEDNRLAVDSKNSIVSHQYIDVLEDERALEKYHDPVITPNPEKDRENVAQMQEILGDTMPVVLTGHGMIYYAPWDIIARLRGVEPILMDVYERPEYLHKIIGLFTRGVQSRMDQMDQYGLFDAYCMNLHCTPGLVTHKEKAHAPPYTRKDIWFRTMAQMFSSISPAMHEEFDMQYTYPVASRCAYTYYGCCEPLHDRIDRLKKYPNLRKVGVSPWADVEKSGEWIGKDYVFSRKPNPAHVMGGVDEEVVRKEIEQTICVCQKYGCPMDITLKDISTVSYNPKNLMIWAETVSKVLDEYYGE